MGIDNLDIAWQLASKSWKVFPCGPDKTPKNQSGNGWQEATDDLDVIYDWWQKYPDALVGIACQPSGLFVLNLDRHINSPDGVATFKQLEVQYGNNPVVVGPVQSTPGQGYHLFFKAPSLPPNFKLPVTLAHGIDIKFSGYVCTGIFPNERAYEWMENHGYFTPLTYPPDWVGHILLGQT